MNSEELKQVRRDFSKKINKEEREINREIMSYLNIFKFCKKWKCFKSRQRPISSVNARKRMEVISISSKHMQNK